MFDVYIRYGSKKSNRDVMTCHDKSLPSPDGRSLRLWCKNRSQLVAFGIIHEITFARTFWPHFATFVTFARQEITYVRTYVCTSRRWHAPRCHDLCNRKLRVRSRRRPGLGLTVTTSLTVASSARFVSCKDVAVQSAACDGGLSGGQVEASWVSLQRGDPVRAGRVSRRRRENTYRNESGCMVAKQESEVSMEWHANT